MLCNRTMTNASTRIALGDCQNHGLQHGKPGEESIDLKCSCHAKLDTLVLRKRRDFLIAKKDITRRRGVYTGQEVDECGLAGAVRPDQRLASTWGEHKGYVAVRLERAPFFRQILGA